MTQNEKRNRQNLLCPVSELWQKTKKKLEFQPTLLITALAAVAALAGDVTKAAKMVAANLVLCLVLIKAPL